MQDLSSRVTIPQIKEKLHLINEVGTYKFWQSPDILNFEKVRVEQRSLIKFIEGMGERPLIYTNLNDEALLR